MASKALSQRLEGAAAVVTGGARGIGRATAQRLALEGARVLIIDLDQVEQAEQLAPGVQFSPCDVSVEGEVEHAIELAAKQFGRLDVLVNNAGIVAYADATTMTEQEWRSFFDVDLKSAWLCSKYAIPHMRRAGRGAIVNVASIHATLTAKGMFPYAAAKAGLVGLTRSLALDLGSDGIRVNAVCPGYTRTRLVEQFLSTQSDRAAAEEAIVAVLALDRIAEPAEVASAIAFLASDDASYVTGTTLSVDGGLSARFA